MEPLLDPLGDRVVKDVTPPPHRVLDRNLLYYRGIKHPPDWIVLRDHLEAEGKISKEDCLLLLRQVTELLRTENNLLEAMEPITVVGDIHGQFYDLLKLLELGLDPNRRNYLFLGNYVNRGSFSIEVTLLLYALKLNFPNTFFMLRGNHECRQMTSLFNFRQETLYKYDTEVYDAFMESFDALPLACIVNDRFIALHGGISPELSTLGDISILNRFQEPPKQGLFCDILWSDPVDNSEGSCLEKYIPNTIRACSFNFGLEAVNEFLQKNNLLSIFRGHQVKFDGYKMHQWQGFQSFPCVITIFSAPNYCDIYNNKGAILKIENNGLNLVQFNCKEHPYTLPNFMGLFEWNIPFVIEKALEMMLSVTQSVNKFEAKRLKFAQNLMKNSQKNTKETNVEIFRYKIEALAKILNTLKYSREDTECIMQLKGLCPNNKVPRKLLLQGRETILKADNIFSKARAWDIINEKRPD